MATAAGNLVVHLMARTGQFEKGMGRARAQINQMSSAAGLLSGSMKSLAGVFGVSLGAAGFIAGLQKATSLAQSQIDAERKLEAVLVATGHAAGFTTQQLKDQALALQMVTNYGDETTLQFHAVLATFKNIRGDVFKEATHAGLDMAAVMGTDLQSAAVQLGKALNDPTRGLSALTRVGISFTEQQKSQIKAMQEAGDMAGAQGVILRELEGEFGGAAEAMANPMTQLGNALGDLGETIGMQVLPFARMLAEDLTQETNAAAEAANKSTSEFGGLASGIFAAADAAQALAIGFKQAQLASTKLILWNEETGKSWWGWMGEDPEADAFIENLQATVKQLEKGLAKTSSDDWAAAMEKRYRKIQDMLKTPGGPSPRTPVDGEVTSLPEWHEGLDFAMRNRGGSGGPPVPVFDEAGLAGLFDVLQKQIDDKAAMDKLGQQLEESLMTPAEKLEQRVEEINRLSEAGSITDETRIRALQQIADEAAQEDDTTSTVRFAGGAMTRGGREEWSAIMAAMGQGRESSDKQIASNTEAMKKELGLIKHFAELQVKALQEAEGVEIPTA